MPRRVVRGRNLDRFRSSDRSVTMSVSAEQDEYAAWPQCDIATRQINEAAPCCRPLCRLGPRPSAGADGACPAWHGAGGAC
eukprot:6668338-Prymnesium_polylepis.1